MEIIKYGRVLETIQKEKEPFVEFGVLGATRRKKSICEKRRRDSIIRTRKILLRSVLFAIEKFGTPLLCTFTNKGIATDVYLSRSYFRSFTMRLRRRYAGIQYIAVPELSPRGRIHYHCLLFGLPMSWGDKRCGERLIYKGRERITRTIAGFWRQGFVDVSQTDGSGRLGFYLAKYLVKAGIDPFFASGRLVLKSQGILSGERLVEGKKARYERILTNLLPYSVAEYDTKYYGKIVKKIYHMGFVYKS